MYQFIYRFITNKHTCGSCSCCHGCCIGISCGISRRNCQSWSQSDSWSCTCSCCCWRWSCTRQESRINSAVGLKIIKMKSKKALYTVLDFFAINFIIMRYLDYIIRRNFQIEQSNLRKPPGPKGWPSPSTWTITFPANPQLLPETLPLKENRVGVASLYLVSSVTVSKRW